MKQGIRLALLTGILGAQLLAFVSGIPLEALLSPLARTIRLAADLYDPVHPMKGRYLALTFDVAPVPKGEIPGLAGKTEEELDGLAGKEVYCLFSEGGAEGFSRIEDIRETRPEGGEWYVRGCVLRVDRTEDGETKVSVDFPADRYYLQETLAGEAGRLLMNSIDRAALVVKVGRGGSFAVSGLELGGRPLEERAGEGR